MFRFKQTLLASATFILLGFAATASTASAAPVVLPTLVDRTTFNAVAPTNTTVDFQTATPNNGYAGSLTLTGLQFSFTGTGAPTCGGCGIGVAAGSNFGLNPGEQALFVNASGVDFNTETLLITPQTATRAIGFEIKSSNGTQLPGVSAGSYRITVTLANGDTYTTDVTNTSYSTFSFIGFSSADVDIASVAIAALSGGQPLVDNISYSATAEAVPEPATMVLLGTGLAGVASFVRKRRRAHGEDEEACDEAAEAVVVPQG